MGLAITFFIIYMVFPPGLMGLLKFLKNQAKQALFGRRMSKSAIRAAAEKEGINKKVSKRVEYTLRDPRDRPLPFRLVFIIIYLIGAGIAIYGGVIDKWGYLFIAIMIAYFGIIFAYISANKLITERDIILKRMLELKGSKMRFVNKERGVVVRPETEFRVLEWNEDLITPQKIHLYMPTDFDILEVDRFLESFNLIFGGNGQWIADADDKEYGGFDFNAGVAAIKVSGKLPQIAMWHERYLSDKDIHWSFFPLALGSENGVPVFNDELGITENVLGFAVNSGQEKHSKKKGVLIGPEITAAPQILIAGGTGGGKALASTTKVRILKRES